MPSTARVAPGGFVYHVLNRSVGLMHMFRKESDFAAFERVMVEAHLRQPVRILSYGMSEQCMGREISLELDEYHMFCAKKSERL